tara:strand:+ start:459 stop:1133 length:675 start_codon:yes stop_codon:yes gene_type:complete
VKVFLTVLLFSFTTTVWAHGVDDATRQFLTSNEGISIMPYMYIGAKHMVTGYDHLLFLIGVIFFLFRAKDVMVYVTFFTLGHSLTLMLGVLNDISLNPYLIDAIIGFSIIYKGFDNLGGFKRLIGFQPNTKAAVLIFGLFHGFGLATKIQEFKIPDDGLLENLISFNVGVEIGQLIALTFVLIAISFWRKHSSYIGLSTATNTLLMSGGMMLVGFQLTGMILTL